MLGRALVVGGTKDFGAHVSAELFANGYEIVTVSRTSSCLGHSSVLCDVVKLGTWNIMLDQLLKTYERFDVIACVVGGTPNPKKPERLTGDDWLYAMNTNFFYVDYLFKKFGDMLSKIPNAAGILVGSRWSFRTDNEYILPYITAKHALAALCGDIAKRYPKLRINNYCAPPMDTEAFHALKEKMDKAYEGPHPDFDMKQLADSKTVAVTMVRHALATSSRGEVFRVERDGAVTIAVCQPGYS